MGPIKGQLAQVPNLRVPLLLQSWLTQIVILIRIPKTRKLLNSKKIQIKSPKKLQIKVINLCLRNRLQNRTTIYRIFSKVWASLIQSKLISSKPRKKMKNLKMISPLIHLKLCLGQISNPLISISEMISSFQNNRILLTSKLNREVRGTQISLTMDLLRSKVMMIINSIRSCLRDSLGMMNQQKLTPTKPFLMEMILQHFDR